MTKIKSLIFLLMAGIAFMPLLAVAATLSLSPANVSVTRGQTFTMTVALNPQGVKIYTVKVELKYPTNLLEVQSFNFASGWLPLTQSGYDQIDNVNGVLIKTAGYPGGISGPATFGTVSLRAKTSGSGNVTVTVNSVAYDSGSQNILTGVPVSASVSVSAPAATPVPTPITGEVTVPTPTPEAGEVEEEEEIALEPEPEEGVGFFAAIGNLFTLGTGRAWVAALVILVILGLVYYLVSYSRRKNLK